MPAEQQPVVIPTMRPAGRAHKNIPFPVTGRSGSSSTAEVRPECLPHEILEETVFLLD